MDRKLTDLDLTINGVAYFAILDYTPIGYVEDHYDRGEYFGTPYTHTTHEFITVSVEVYSLRLYLNDGEGTPVLDTDLITQAILVAEKELCDD